MDRQQIRAEIQDLARSQGFYGRLLRDIEELEQEEPESAEQFWKDLEDQNFEDSLDMVLYFET